MGERRIIDRKKVLKTAQIQLDKLSSINCAVRNISMTGACLEVTSPLGIPKASLVIESEALNRQCVVAWRTTTRVGVAFQ